MFLAVNNEAWNLLYIFSLKIIPTNKQRNKYYLYPLTHI